MPIPRATRLMNTGCILTMGSMIITHTKNEYGDVRLYIGGKGSIECWLEPANNGRWTFHMDEAVSGNRLTDADRKAWAMYVLNELANTLNVPPDQLSNVPFERLAAAHSQDPFAGRRLPLGRANVPDNCFKAAPPHIQAKFKDKARNGARPCHSL